MNHVCNLIFVQTPSNKFEVYVTKYSNRAEKILKYSNRAEKIHDKSIYTSINANSSLSTISSEHKIASYLKMRKYYHIVLEFGPKRFSKFGL